MPQDALMTVTGLGEAAMTVRKGFMGHCAGSVEGVVESNHEQQGVFAVSNIVFTLTVFFVFVRV